MFKIFKMFKEVNKKDLSEQFLKRFAKLKKTARIFWKERSNKILVLRIVYVSVMIPILWHVFTTNEELKKIRVNPPDFVFEQKNEATDSAKIAESETKISIKSSKVVTPKSESENAVLSVSGVVEETNRQRAGNGLSALTRNGKLDMSAFAKARDIMERQYFAHDSPDGIGADTLAGNAGYEYLIVGENLALGNFANDAVLVQAWMDSPGHRANILSSAYTEIGVAVLQGTYEGRTTWVAVQHFGKPLSSCPQPDKSMPGRIDGNKTRLDQLESEINAKKAEMDGMEPKAGPAYNQKVDEYNALVNAYNSLAEETKKMVDDYNRQIEVFNECAK